MKTNYGFQLSQMVKRGIRQQVSHKISSIGGETFGYQSSEILQDEVF